MNEQTTEVDSALPEDSAEYVSKEGAVESVPANPPDHPADEPNDDAEPEIFPREYVQKLRDESARHRQRASDRDTLTERSHGCLVAADPQATPGFPPRRG